MAKKSITTRIEALENFRSKKQTMIVLHQDLYNPDLFHYGKGPTAEIITRAEGKRRFFGDEFLVLWICYDKTIPGDDFD